MTETMVEISIIAQSVMTGMEIQGDLAKLVWLELCIPNRLLQSNHCHYLDEFWADERQHQAFELLLKVELQKKNDAREEQEGKTGKMRKKTDNKEIETCRKGNSNSFLIFLLQEYQANNT